MPTEAELQTRLIELMLAEYERIGFTAHDYMHLGFGRGDEELTAARIDEYIASLREVPSGIGAQAFFARFGVDFYAIIAEAEADASLLRPRE